MQRINEKLAEISTFDSQPMGRGQTDKLLMVIRMLSWINSDYWITMGGGLLHSYRRYLFCQVIFYTIRRIGVLQHTIAFVDSIKLTVIKWFSLAQYESDMLFVNG